MKSFLTITMIAFIPRLIILLFIVPHSSLFYPPDATTYELPAINMLAGNGFSQEHSPPYLPDIYRTPVYPAFIAAIYALVGPLPQAVALVQIIIASLTAGITYLLGRLTLTEQKARLSGFLLAISPVSILYSVPLLTETVFTLLFLLMSLVLAFYLKYSRPGLAVAAGLLLGFAILCRPVALLYPPIGAVTVALKRKRDALLFLVGVLVIVAPWVWRNYVTTGVASVSLISNLNLLYYNAANLQAYLDNEDYFVVREEIRQQVEAKIGTDASAKAKNEIFGEWGKRIIFAHPIEYVYTHLAANTKSLMPDMLFFTILMGLEDDLTFRALPGWELYDFIPALSVYILFLAILYAGAIVGVIKTVRHRDWWLLVILLTPIVYLLMIPGMPATPRFRVPAQPFICLLAAVGLIKQKNHQEILENSSKL